MVYGDAVVGQKPRSVLHEEAQRVQASRLVSLYESHELTLASPLTNVSLPAAVNHATSCTCGRAAGGFDLVPRAQRVTIRNMGTGTIQVRLGSSTADRTSLDAGEYLDWAFLELLALYFTNPSGIAVPIRVTLA